jgi:parallel beta-helix repeat protein
LTLHQTTLAMIEICLTALLTVCDQNAVENSIEVPAPEAIPVVITTNPAGPKIMTFIRSGPVVLRSGQTVSGRRISNPHGACIEGTGVSNVRIYNNKIGPCGPLAGDAGISLNHVHDVLVAHNSFDDVSGALLASKSTNNIVFEHNYATRIRGPFPRGQIVQFNQVVGSGNRISCNVSDQTTPGYGNGTEDHINTWLSSGTAASPILIKFNKLRGGGPSKSGGGIIAGDGGGSYITIDTNILVNPGQYGVAIAGGHDNKLLNNKVYSSSFAWSNVGAFVWIQNDSVSYGHEVSGNRVNWTNKIGQQNSWWNQGNTGPVITNGNVFGDASIGVDIWNETFPQCDDD